MREKRLKGMIWRRLHATYAITLPLAAVIAVLVLVTHAASQWWSLEGAPLLLLAYLFASLADLNAVADQLTGDRRNGYRGAALLCTLAGVLLIIGFTTGHVPFPG